MKQLFLKKSLMAGMLFLAVPASLLAQKEKEKEKVKDKDGFQQIIITKKGDNAGKTVIEIDGDKVKVNGKDASDDKDVTVNVNKMNGRTFYRTAPGAYSYSFNNDDHMALFGEDSNRPMLGVTTEGTDKGAEVMAVNKESGAEKAGLKKGDIITSIGGKKIESSDDVTEAVRAHKPGDKVEIAYLRDGKQEKATAELSAWKGIRMNAVTVPKIEGLNRLREFTQVSPPDVPMTWNNGNIVFGSGRPKLGLSIQDTEDGKGVKVLDVDDDSNAAKAGVKEGDIITQVDDKAITSADEMSRTIRSKTEQGNYKLQVLRGGKQQTIEVKIPKKLKTVDL
jgi:serine protease Do